MFVRESEVVTDYCEPHSLILNLCHKKTASGVYSQEAQLRKQAFDDLGGGTRNRDRAQGKCHREF